ncbi:hypothetical protein [Desulfogranum marinum]|uniref:hypothetical protein n=1 Tax=Desulfogranum marinum TaxID=453220 RepID=UPI0029C75BAD|nr:hypothetical protein [Desulfogranum marinum]
MTGQKKARFYPLTVQSVSKTKSSFSSAGISIRIGDDKYRIDLAEEFSTPTLTKLIKTLEQL